MARHLGDLTDDEWRSLIDVVVRWLTRHQVSGSLAKDYSLYRCLDDERDRAIRNLRRHEQER